MTGAAGAMPPFSVFFFLFFCSLRGWYAMYHPGISLSSTDAVAYSHHVRSIGAVGRVKGMHWDRGRLIMALTCLISPFRPYILLHYMYLYVCIPIHIV